MKRYPVPPAVVQLFVEEVVPSPFVWTVVTMNRFVASASVPGGAPSTVFPGFPPGGVGRATTCASPRTTILWTASGAGSATAFPSPGCRIRTMSLPDRRGDRAHLDAQVFRQPFHEEPLGSHHQGEEASDQDEELQAERHGTRRYKDRAAPVARATG